VFRRFAQVTLGFLTRIFRRHKAAEPAAEPPPLPAPKPARAPIWVQLRTPQHCAITGCRRDPNTWVSLSSRDRLFLCGKHALAVETQRTRWRTTDPSAATHRISRITVAKA
jgi:hypothetical protein